MPVQLALLDLKMHLLADAFPDLASQDEILLLAADVTSPAALEVAMDATLKVGALGGLIHIAGGFEMGESVSDLSRESWMRMMDLNAWSFVCAARAAVPVLRRAGGGRIVAVSARAAAKGAAQMAAYCAAKSALQRLVESLSQEVKGDGVNVNSVAPSLIDTPANRAAMPKAKYSDWVSSDQLAEVIAFLACDSGAAGIHGQHVVVDGLV
jgi:NAD(P)-dependent dehydrogenase (short-subunit alcohol dehydrogenase family)